MLEQSWEGRNRTAERACSSYASGKSNSLMWAFHSLFELGCNCSIFAAILLYICGLRFDPAIPKAKSAKFPVKFPVSREFARRRGSHATAHSAI